ncbi:MAG: hypothetical protein E7672_06790 [Ruminococcaceae bacterium]|nr:hypothetical protein [Oscillospiraceae bacterium]
MKNRKITKLLSVILSAIILSSCADPGAYISSDGGVGRDPDGTVDTAGKDSENASSDKESSTESDETTEPPAPVITEFTWALENGKYVYQIPEREESDLSDLSDIAHLYGTYFDDQPEGYDWFPGKLSRDLTTGEVTYAWDRWPSTLTTLKKYGGIYRGDETRKVMYLTFDCGYEHGTTAQILDTLKEKNVPAIFFVTGHYVRENKDLLDRMLAEGHLIGNHTVNHKKMTQVSAETFIDEIKNLEALFQEQCPDAPDMHYFRPPSGTSNEWLLAMCDKMGYRSVMWSWTYKDFDTNNQPPVAEALENAKKGLHNGAVYLLHAESQTNADMLGDLIDWIRAQGYEILPICDIPRE